MSIDSGSRVSLPPRSTEQFISDLREWAILYASGDFPVFPLHSPKKKGVCDCPDTYKDGVIVRQGGALCDSPAKHPRTISGFKDASCDESVIQRWWSMWTRANIGLAVPSGYVVLDIDGQEGLDALTQHGYWLPDTPLAITGKGWHYWFKTSSNLPPRAKMLPKVDLRGPGSYVVAPPSLHISGKQYHWEHSIIDVPFHTVPGWLVDLAHSSPGIANGTTSDRSYLDTERLFATGIGEGERDATLFRVSSKLRAVGIPQDVAEGVIAELAARCQPPFNAAEAMKKVASAYNRYAPGTWSPVESYPDPRIPEWQASANGQAIDDVPGVNNSP